MTLWSVLLIGEDKELRSRVFSDKEKAQQWANSFEDEEYHSAIYIQELPN